MAKQANVTVLTDDNGVQREYAEVKRKADVGERVKVVLSDNGMRPQKGDVLKIVIANENDDFVDGGVPASCMRPENYVVLEPTSTVIIDGVRYREEKRKAAVGEKVLVFGHCMRKANGVFTVDYIEEGDVIKYSVNGENGFGTPYTHGIDPNYVVLTPETPAPAPISITLNVTVASMDDAVQAVADAVKAELAKMDAKTADVVVPKPKSPQELRDEIVERAKADVADLITKVDSHEWDTSGIPLHFDCGRLRVEFVVDRNKRTVVALARFGNLLSSKTVCGRGIAKCAPGDVFNSHIGRAIALRRALGLDVPAEYTNAPKPTEVRVGDAFETTCKSISGKVMRFCDEVEGVSRVYGKPFLHTHDSGWLGVDQIEITDDSREEVSA
ncbi:hypothetical protein KM924_23205 [Brevibacillus parabrevis]|uniref:hypothetical protein n=1 Tax=Brevibacillus parabrevis TaxID=54914 RepID=UPI001C21432B|nr:hypothetical protein [Brevibacillus parabrevis]MBU8715414.1 hypothetical protein [Brevibacillus parabrevis]